MGKELTHDQCFDFGEAAIFAKSGHHEPLRDRTAAGRTAACGGQSAVTVNVRLRRVSPKTTRRASTAMFARTTRVRFLLHHHNVTTVRRDQGVARRRRARLRRTALGFAARRADAHHNHPHPRG